VRAGAVSGDIWLRLTPLISDFVCSYMCIQNTCIMLPSEEQRGDMGRKSGLNCK